MTASPNSAVSSDLYSPSEPELLKPRGQEGTSSFSDFPISIQDGNTEAEVSGYSDTMQGLDSAGEETSRQSSVAAAATVAVSGEPSHKRKRDDETESIRILEGSKVLVHQDGRPVTGKSEGFGLLSRSQSQWQDIGKPKYHFQTKRSRMDSKEMAYGKEFEPSRRLSTLPAALWQYVFCFVPPVFLGRLLRVNHAFNSYLTMEKYPESSRPLTHSIIQPMSAEAIWVASRRHFAPGLPRPIRGMHELDMWRLLVGRNCQRCGTVEAAKPLANPGSPWESGPGDSGVRIVWPFGLRCCGSCLQYLSQKVLSTVQRHLQEDQADALIRETGIRIIFVYLPIFPGPRYSLRFCFQRESLHYPQPSQKPDTSFNLATDKTLLQAKHRRYYAQVRGCKGPWHCHCGGMDKRFGYRGTRTS